MLVLGRVSDGLLLNPPLWNLLLASLPPVFENRRTKSSDAFGRTPVSRAAQRSARQAAGPSWQWTLARGAQIITNSREAVGPTCSSSLIQQVLAANTTSFKTPSDPPLQTHHTMIRSSHKRDGAPRLSQQEYLIIQSVEFIHDCFV